MVDTKSTPEPLALRAALAIIKAVGNPALRDPAKNVTAGELAAIIQRELDMTVLGKAIDEALEEIEHSHGDMLTEPERSHPRGSGWARVYDRLCRARDLINSRAERPPAAPFPGGESVVVRFPSERCRP